MTSKKSSFFRFIFSLIPGAGEMYMGFLKMGVSLMSLFLFIFFLAVLMGIGPLVLINLVIWSYSFFHVHNLAGLPDEEFYSIEDRYLFCSGGFIADEKSFLANHHKIVAAIFIFIGILFTWRGLLEILSDLLPEELYHYVWRLSFELPRIFAGIAIILIGIMMIRGKKKELESWQNKEEIHERSE